MQRLYRYGNRELRRGLNRAGSPPSWQNGSGPDPTPGENTRCAADVFYS